VNSSRLSGIAALGALALVLSGCAGDEQAAVGVDSLSIATLGPVTPSEQAFVDRMNELSEGSITLDVTENWAGSGDGPDEIALTEAVAAGDVDIAWVTVRSLRAIGITGIDALEAPMMIQTHDQQRAVALGVPAELLMRKLRNSPVQALAMLPGPVLYPITSGTPLLSAADWAGATFQVGAAGGAEALTAETLGATASEGDGGAADVVNGSVQAAAAAPGDLPAAGVAKDGPVMSASMALWPRMSMIIINRDVLDRLTSRQNGFLQGSVVRAQDSAMAAGPDLEAQVAAACEAGALFGISTQAEIDEMRELVSSVYSKLSEDKADAKLLTAIEEAVKRHAGTGALVIPKACRWVAPK